MNRVTISEGELYTNAQGQTTVVTGTSGSLGDSTIQNRTNQTAGTAITYNADGEQATSTTYSTFTTIGGRGGGGKTTQVTNTQNYSYSSDGNLQSVSVNGLLQATYTRDALGRIIQQQEYNTTANANQGRFGAVGTQIYSHIYSYNSNSQITSDQVSSVQYNASNGTVTNSVTSTTYNYGIILVAGQTYVAGDYADGNVISQAAASTTYTGVPVTSSASTTTNTTNSYLWLDSAQQASISAIYAGAQSGTTTSTFSYDHNGHVSQVTTTGQNAHTSTYIESAAGLILQNDELLTSGGSSAPETFYYYFNDQQIGQIGNNGVTNTSYSASVSNQTSIAGNGAFAQGASAGAPAASFDTSANPVTATGNGSAAAGSAYTVQSGDSIAAIAQKVFGDANLWYVIAQANGLSLNSPLATGQVLTIPNAVVNTGNTATTTKPYNANAALGDVQPGAPIPPAQSGGGCGIIGEILKAVILVASVALFGPANPVAAALFAAETDLEVQGIGVLIGAQHSIDWTEVAITGISAGVASGIGQIGQATGGILGANNFAGAALRGALGSTVTQGIGVATGLQKNFSFAEVAAAGIGGGIENNISGSSFGRGFGRIGNQLVSGVAGDIANAATKSLLDGSDFGDNIITALPATIGNTIGDLLQAKIAGTKAPATSGIGGRAPQISLTSVPIATSTDYDAIVAAAGPMPDLSGGGAVGVSSAAGLGAPSSGSNITFGPSVQVLLDESGNGSTPTGNPGQYPDGNAYLHIGDMANSSIYLSSKYDGGTFVSRIVSSADGSFLGEIPATAISTPDTAYVGFQWVPNLASGAVGDGGPVFNALFDGIPTLGLGAAESLTARGLASGAESIAAESGGSSGFSGAYATNGELVQSIATRADNWGIGPGLGDGRSLALSSMGMLRTC